MESPSFAGQLDALAQWRGEVGSRLGELERFLAEHELLDDTLTAQAQSALDRLASDRLAVAFVAEFSRGKSELINAIFFADTGRRVLPATPGRTTMCPVELGREAGAPPMLALLPIETRLDTASLAELRERSELWKTVRLDPSRPDELAEALSEVRRTKSVSVGQARALGLWRDDAPEDNPPLGADGHVEIPAWRHAVINYPHPLLERGLVVLDTPGLNAIGAEPELTLSLLPAAHAAVFVLAADTGVTKSDLAVWRDHLSGQTLSRFVVLNKIDTLADPMLGADEVRAQIEQQRRNAAETLAVPIDQVFPLSARQALTARVDGDKAALAASGLPELEAALSMQLLPQRRQLLLQGVLADTQLLHTRAAGQLSDQRRQLAEQMLELRGLRGKSVAKLRSLLERARAESADFERCTAKLAALRAVQARLLQDTLTGLSVDRLRDEMAQMQREIAAGLFNLGARKAFLALCLRLRELLAAAHGRAEEAYGLVNASFRQLNSEFGFALTLATAPTLERQMRDLDLIERSYAQYLGLSHAFKLSEPRFMEQFRRMLAGKLRVLFESASAEVELWHKGAATQIELQLRDRRRGYKRRHEALERVQSAAGELETRIEELELQEQRVRLLQARLDALADAVRDGARSLPTARSGPTLTLVSQPASSTPPRAASSAA